MVLRLIRTLPGDRAFLPPSLAENDFHQLDASVEASGPHDFTVRACAFVKAPPASTASRSNVRDDRDTPLLWDGMARHTPVIWVRFKQEYFCEGGWTGNLGARPSGKSVSLYLAASAFRFITIVDEVASQDAQLHIWESITTIGSMDSGPAPSGASRNDERGKSRRTEQLLAHPYPSSLANSPFTARAQPASFRSRVAALMFGLKRRSSRQLSANFSGSG
jgi:hypothetical protein